MTSRPLKKKASSPPPKSTKLDQNDDAQSLVETEPATPLDEDHALSRDRESQDKTGRPDQESEDIVPKEATVALSVPTVVEPPVTSYPTDLNPFGEEEEEDKDKEEYPESLNPFGDDDEDDDDRSSTCKTSLYDDSLNPFSEGDDTSFSSTASPRRPSPRVRKKQAAPPPPTIKKNDDDTPSKSTFAYWKRKKRPAPSVPVPVRREIKRIPLKEIQAEMEEIATKQEELERQGREIEMQIRDRNGKYSRDGLVPPPATAGATASGGPFAV
ncbi:hypothetical protein MTO96_021145 [Rhipicephalus appendiculatus]